MKTTRKTEQATQDRPAGKQRQSVRERPISRSMQTTIVRNGDTAFLQEHPDIDSILSDTGRLSENPVRNIKYDFLLMASEITQACIAGGMGKAEAEALRDSYICKMDRYRKKEEICKIYRSMCMDFAERMQNVLQQDIISWHVRRCMDYVHENLHCNLSIKTLAQLVGLNPSYLSRLFKQETGSSVKQFVISARMEQAKELLQHTDMTYLEISVRLGFSSQSAFIAIFKKIYDMTPKQYRMKTNQTVQNTEQDDSDSDEA